MNMKKILPFILLLFTTSIFAQVQNQNEKLEKALNKIVEKHNPKFGEKSVTLRLDSTHHFYYNDIDLSWRIANKHEYTYTPIGLVKERIVWTLFADGWRKAVITTYSYTPNNVLSDIVITVLDFEVNALVNKTKEGYTYNALGQNTEITHYRWNKNLSVWEYNYKEHLTYNSNGNLDVTNIYTWDKNINDWLLDSRVRLYYNSNQAISCAITEIRQDSRWVGDKKHDWTYDANNFLIRISTSVYRTDLLTFLEVYRIFYFNNEYGHPYLEDHQNNYGNIWLSNSLIEITLDANNYIERELYHSFNFCNFLWSTIFKEEYFYTNVTSVNDLVAKTTVKTYPNPVSDVLIINSDDDISNLRIFNINGQLVMSINPASKEATIDVSNFANGVYFVHVLSNDKNTVQKIVVQN